MNIKTVIVAGSALSLSAAAFFSYRLVASEDRPKAAVARTNPPAIAQPSEPRSQTSAASVPPPADAVQQAPSALPIENLIAEEETPPPNAAPASAEVLTPALSAAVAPAMPVSAALPGAKDEAVTPRTLVPLPPPATHAVADAVSSSPAAPIQASHREHADVSVDAGQLARATAEASALRAQLAEILAQRDSLRRELDDANAKLKPLQDRARAEVESIQGVRRRTFVFQP